MYIAKRTPKIHEEMQLGENGPVLTVNLDTDDVVTGFEMRRAAVVQCQMKVANLRKENPGVVVPEGILAEYGKAIMEWFRYIFGDEQAEQIYEYYEGKSIEMINEVFPFITDCIMPKIKKSMEHINSRNKQKYTNKGRHNKWRRQ